MLLPPYIHHPSCTHHVPVIAEQLTYILNLTVSEGKLPLEWKSARVMPLHKGGDRDNLDNYRPISRLCCLAKVLESLVNDQVKSFLSTFSVLSPFQSGFRAQHSTISAATLVVNDIVTALDQEKHCAALFIDLSKAFDTVDHSLLLHCLASLGLDNTSLNFFLNYFSDRRQCVSVGTVRSEFLPLTKGVPQGSILGPVLFTIYINNILTALGDSCKAHLYADDTIIYCTADSLESANLKLQHAFDHLQRAFKELKLVLNASKTKVMFFTKSRNIDVNSFQISLSNGSILERVKEYKYLGLWIDEKLTFKHHVDILSSKLRQKIGFLYRNRSNFPPSCRKRVIESVFMSVLDYGDVIYRHAAVTTLKALDSVYHSALRFITQDKYNTHHCVLYDKVGWTSLAARRDYHWYQFIFKGISGRLPPYITSLLDWNVSSYQTRSSKWLVCTVPQMSTKLGRTAYSYDAANTWNSIQNSLKLDTLPSLNDFRNLVFSICVSPCNCF